MPHNQQGYAVMKWQYPAVYTRIVETRDMNGISQRREVLTSLITRTFWAKCAKNETGDPFISRWVSEKVLPLAENLVKQYIDERVAKNTERHRRWNADRATGLIAQGEPRPVQTIYEEYNSQRLALVGKPHRNDFEHTNNSSTGQIAWLDRRGP